MKDRWWWLPLLVPPLAGCAAVGTAWALSRRRGLRGYGDDGRMVRFVHGHGECPYCRGSLVCEAQPPPSLCHSAEAFSQIKPIVMRRQAESFWVFVLDARNRIVGKAEISRGSLTQAVVHPREVFGTAIRRRGAAVILVHNHPSGEPSPSPEDDQLTKRLVDVGKLIGIPVLDHLVVARKSGTYYSYRDGGRM